MTESTEPKSGYNNQMGKDRGRYTCLAWKSDVNVNTLMKMEPKGSNANYGICLNYIG